MARTRRHSIFGGGEGGRAIDHHYSKRKRVLPPGEDEEPEEEDEHEVLADEQSECSSPKSPQPVKLRSSDALDCPICCEPLKKPIYQCENGHHACSSCCKKLKKKCSLCKSRIGDIRCIAMEKVIEETVVSCENAIHGCQESTTYGNQLIHHEKNLCDFTQCYCPLPDCNYVGSYEDLKLHARSLHPNHGNLNTFEFNSTTFFPISLDKPMAVLQEEKEGDLFVVQAFKRLSFGEGLYVTVRHIAPPGAKKFSCSLTKPEQVGTLKVGMMVKKIQKVVVSEELEEDDDFMLIPSNKLKNEHWKMQICIGFGYAYIFCDDVDKS